MEKTIRLIFDLVKRVRFFVLMFCCLIVKMLWYSFAIVVFSKKIVEWKKTVAINRSVPISILYSGGNNTRSILFACPDSSCLLIVVRCHCDMGRWFDCMVWSINYVVNFQWYDYRVSLSSIFPRRQRVLFLSGSSVVKFIEVENSKIIRTNTIAHNKT